MHRIAMSAGKSEPLAKLGVAKLLKHELVGDLPLERDTCQPGGGFVEPFDRRLQLGGRLWIGQELGLERDVHATTVLVLSSKVKTGGPLLIPMAEQEIAYRPQIQSIKGDTDSSR